MKNGTVRQEHFILLLLFLAGVSACAPRPYRAPSRPVVYREKGLASWYGRDFHGRKTASGERYNMNAVSAAHRTLPLGTIARVTHLKNRKAVIVKINDRGPFIEGRIVDLSYGAARRLGMVREGVAPVLLEVFGRPKGTSIPTPSYSVQVGSFFNRENAENLRALLSREFSGVYITDYRGNNTIYYRVRLGHFTSKAKAHSTGHSLEKRGYSYLVVREN